MKSLGIDGICHLMTSIGFQLNAVKGQSSRVSFFKFSDNDERPFIKIR